MDMFVVDCGDRLPEIGKEVLILDENHISEIMRDRNIIEYCIYSTLNGRAERIYTKNSDETASEKSCKGQTCTNERK